MPVTPFHFGVGLLGKGVAPRAVSLCAFVASQIAIDCESAYFLFVARAEPVHRVLHTLRWRRPSVRSSGWRCGPSPAASDGHPSSTRFEPIAPSGRRSSEGCSAA